jgi:NAD(P)-dependent dehydrogenase (short-subunit alcohol dehydrogenase family)
MGGASIKLLQDLCYEYFERTQMLTSNTYFFSAYVSLKLIHGLPRCRLAGKVAVITGGASGIGEATAKEFIRNGAKVIIADVQDDLGHAVAAELGPDAAYTRCDVTDEAQIAAAVDLAVACHGRLDVLHNNAGVTCSYVGPLASLDLADFDRVMAVNARAVLAGIKHAARVMAPRRAAERHLAARHRDAAGDARVRRRAGVGGRREIEAGHRGGHERAGGRKAGGGGHREGGGVPRLRRGQVHHWA